MTSPVIDVRPAGTTDLSTLVEFNRLMAMESEDKGLDPARLERGVLHLLEHPEEGRYLVAEVDGEVLGALMVTFEWSDWRNGRFWWIQSVYVKPDARRRGVYRTLHTRVRDEARDDFQCCGLRLYVEKDNTGAQATYRNLDMRQTDYLLFEEEF